MHLLNPLNPNLSRTTKMSHVLIIDDDPAILRIVGVTLRGVGHRVTISEDPEETLPLLEAHDFDAVILDLAMPAPDGFEVLRRIRANPGSKSIPVLILSGRDQQGDGARGIREGADDYVQKPFEATELVVRIERLIERNRAEATGFVGHLEAFPAADLLQSLCQGKKTGLLHAADGSGEVEVYIEEGKILHARHGGLRNIDALLVLLEKETGIFRFEPGKTSESKLLPEESLELNRVLLDAAWLEDEVSRRLPLLPSEGQFLKIVAPLPPAPPELESLSLPFEAIHQRLSSPTPIGYAQLLDDELAAPRKVALALVLLIEEGVVQTRVRPATAEIPIASSPADLDPVPTTRPREDLGATFSWLHKSLLQHRTTTEDRQETLHLMVFYDPSVWDRLLKIVETVPESSMPANRSRLLGQLRVRRSGTLRLVEPEGKVLVYLQPLQGKHRKSDLVLSLASATIVWLEDPEAVPRLARLANSLSGTACPLGIIASAPSLPDRLNTVLKRLPSFKIVQEEPRDLSDLLRALPLG
jgi:CheY-like chemotaxis protein